MVCHVQILAMISVFSWRKLKVTWHTALPFRFELFVRFLQKKRWVTWSDQPWDADKVACKFVVILVSITSFRCSKDATGRPCAEWSGSSGPVRTVRHFLSRLLCKLGTKGIGKEMANMSYVCCIEITPAGSPWRAFNIFFSGESVEWFRPERKFPEASDWVFQFAADANWLKFN